MSNEIIIKTPDAIQILQAKIEAFNKQWQEYNQNWTNISRISFDTLTKLTFLEETIKYNNKITNNNETIVERKEDKKLYYYLYNLPNNSGIRIKEQDSTCYVAEDKIQNFSLNSFVYHNGNNFIKVENQDTSNDCLTIDWNETDENWITTCVYNKYGVVLSFSGETIKYGEKIIVERGEGEDNKLYYYLYNLPNHFGIRIKEKGAICYSKQGEGEDKRFSVGNLVYRDGNSFIITKDPTTSGYYFTIDPVNKRLVATYKTAFFSEVGSTFGFNFMQRLDSPYTYSKPIIDGFRDYIISDVNKEILNYCGENYGMEAPFHLYTIKKTDNNTYEEIYDDQIWYFRSEVGNGELKNNLVILHEKPVSAGSFYQLVR